MDQLGTDELGIIFKFIPSRQLLELRRESKVLNAAALPVLRKRLDLSFTLTENISRNLEFWKFLLALPENGFVPSVMKLRISGNYDSANEGYATNLERGFVLSFPVILIEICKVFGTGNGTIIKKLILKSRITSAFLLGIIRYLSPSLEILDMELGSLHFSLFGTPKEAPRIWSFSSFISTTITPYFFKGTTFISEVIPETHELMVALFINGFPLINLKRIEVPKCSHEQEQKDLIKWLEILVQSAPNLTHDPISECRAKCGISAPDNLANLMALAVRQAFEQFPMDLDFFDFLTLEEPKENIEDLASDQLGNDELAWVFKFIPSSQLLKLRGVSELWNGAAIPVLRKRHDVKLILTDDAKRNWDFLKCLRNMPETGFVPSEMIVRGVDEKEWCVLDLEKGSVETPREIWIEICKILGAGGFDQRIRKLKFQFRYSGMIRYGALTSVMMLLMLRHLSTSLEILDLEQGFRNSGLTEKDLDEALNIFKNRFPFTNLKMIVPPSHEIVRTEEEEKNLVRWLNILVQSAPNLTNDPIAECKVDPSKYYHYQNERITITVEQDQNYSDSSDDE